MRTVCRWVVFMLVAGLTLFGTAMGASAHTCGDIYCSGSDGTTRHDTQGTDPQFYGGEIGLWNVDFGSSSGPCGSYSNPDDSCFNTAAAAAANTRAAAYTGVGTDFYYLGAGAGPSGPVGNYDSPYCWGWTQGHAAAHLAHGAPFHTYDTYAWLIVLDIEPSGHWDTGTKSQNADVVSGFRDYVEGFQPAESGCPHAYDSGETYQFAIYSSPGQWSSSFSSTLHITNTPIWTYENCCTSTFPNTYTGGNGAAWFGGSNYHFIWQFGQNPDYDIAAEPWYLPHFDLTVYE